jgi:hypothetical protein
LIEVDAEEVEDLVFFVAAVSARVDAYGGEFASFAPTFDSEGGDAKDFRDFPDGQKVGEVGEFDFSGRFV